MLFPINSPLVGQKSVRVTEQVHCSDDLQEALRSLRERLASPAATISPPPDKKTIDLYKKIQEGFNG